MFSLSMPEIIVIFLAALIFMGPEKIPKLAKDIGKFMRNINSTVNDLKKEIELEEESSVDKNTETVKDFEPEEDPYLNKDDSEKNNNPQNENENSGDEEIKS